MIKIIYLNNAATSYPKPPCVSDAIQEFLNTCNVSPNRGSLKYSGKIIDVIADTRKSLSFFFNYSSYERVIFTKNATEALNLAISGILSKGDHCIATMMDHNSVLRPLHHLEERGIEFSIAKANQDGSLDYKSIERNILSTTKLIVAPHASNVTGTLMDLNILIEIAKNHELPLLIDAAQTAGSINFKKSDYNKLIIAFTGHKSLLGPQGIGGLVLGKEVFIKPLIVGGTGTKSDLLKQPEFLPDFLEAGTPNGVGITGLKAALQFLNKKGISSVRSHELKLSEELWNGLSDIKNIKLFGSEESKDRTGIISFTSNKLCPSDISFILETSFNIISREGLLCAPLAHKAIGTYPKGVLRLSLGFFNSLEEIHFVIDSIKKIMG